MPLSIAYSLIEDDEVSAGIVEEGERNWSHLFRLTAKLAAQVLQPRKFGCDVHGREDGRGKTCVVQRLLRGKRWWHAVGLKNQFHAFGTQPRQAFRCR